MYLKFLPLRKTNCYFPLHTTYILLVQLLLFIALRLKINVQIVIEMLVQQLRNCFSSHRSETKYNE